ncbi:FecR domain-containing protein [Roseibium aggregatum]|uniref:FecR domain-containing protein n=1 Tax=Roseibium aggregatum TaxID=187304 RepID=A0A939EGK0_9HYPH|nr:FecR domain-containing protein [Roseibium aggregatum]MBN9672559.1 FecR domain-containing protein [Roseibium aggregatum]
MSSPAQQAGGCVRTEASDPARVIFKCANGLVLEAEAAAVLQIQDVDGQTRPDSVDLTGRALLIEVAPGSGPFQILTPHAIAAVRGTVFIVDVGKEVTSVFVERGEVEVTRRGGSSGVTLTAGEGVDVSENTPMVTTQWGQQRVDELLARFGR